MSTYCKFLIISLSLSLSFFFQFLSLQNLFIFCFYSHTFVVYLFLLNIDTVCCASPSTFSFIFFLLLDKQTNRQTQMQIAWAAYGTNRLPRTVWQNDQSTCMQNYYKVILINRAWAIFLKPHFVLVTQIFLHAACVTSSTCVTLKNQFLPLPPNGPKGFSCLPFNVFAQIVLQLGSEYRTSLISFLKNNQMAEYNKKALW